MYIKNCCNDLERLEIYYTISENMSAQNSCKIDFPFRCPYWPFCLNGRCWCWSNRSSCCWQLLAATSVFQFFQFLSNFFSSAAYDTTSRTSCKQRGKKQTALNYGRSHQNCTIWKLSWQLPWYRWRQWYEENSRKKQSAAVCAKVKPVGSCVSVHSWPE